MKINYIIIIFIVLSTFGYNDLLSQTVTCGPEGRNILLNNSCNNQANTYMARDSIKITAGYSFSSAQGDMRATINKSLDFDLEHRSQPNAPSMGNINTNLPVGTIPASHNVSETGAMIYNIPIDIPTGTGNLTPNISIVYNSQSGQGIAGYGFNISGISAISRVPQSGYYDNNISEIKFNNTDRFALDGVRLLPQDGSYEDYGTHLFKYQKEITDFSTILSYANNNQSGPVFFIVTTKDGYTIEYGRTISSRLTVHQGVLAWNINKITDRNGNYIDFTYIRSDGELLLDKIKYTGNINSEISPKNSIEFVYERRRVDRNEMYIANGNYIKSDKILKRIVVMNDNIVHREYEFNYFSDYFRTKLYEIKLYGNNGDELNSTRFSYGDIGSYIVSDANNLPLGPNQSYFLGDFTGNGKSDIVIADFEIENDTKLYSKLRLFWNMSIDPSINFNSASVSLGEYNYIDNVYIEDINKINNSLNYTVADFEGIGRDQILVAKQQHLIAGIYKLTDLKTLTYNGSGFSESIFTLPAEVNIYAHNDMRNMVLGDFDGNGNMDIIVGSFLNNNYYLLRPSINGSQRLRKFNTNEATLSVIRKIIDINNNVYTADFNGDGKNDIIVVTESGTVIYEVNFEGESLTFNAIGTAYFLHPDDRINAFADFNGDGKSDILYTRADSDEIIIAYSTGFDFERVYEAGYWPSSLSILRYPRVFIGDFNGDGKMDFMTVAYSMTSIQRNVYYSLGYKGTSNIPSFFKAEQINSCNVYGYEPYTYNAGFFTGDFTGDGKTALIHLHSQEPTQSKIYYSNYLDNSRFVTNIKDGLGNKIEVDYKAITNTHSYSPNLPSNFNYNDNLIEFSKPIYVVTQVTFDNGYDNDATTSISYDYQGSLFNKNTKTWLGFYKTKTTSMVGIDSYNSVQLLSSTEFTPVNNDRLIMPSIQTSGISGALDINKTENTYGVIKPFSQNDKVFYPYMKTTKSTESSGSSTSQKNVTLTANTINIDGNITLSKTTVNTNEFISETRYEYANAGLPYPNKVSQIETKTTYNGQEEVSEKTNFSYDSNNGRIMSKTDYNTNIIERYGLYDNFGNPRRIRIINPDRNDRYTDLTYSSDGRFLIKETTDMGEVTEYKYSTRTGDLIEVTDKYGKSTKYEYDAFNNLKKETDVLGIITTYTSDWETGSGVTNAVYSQTINRQGSPYQKIYYDKLGRPVRNRTVGHANNTLLVDMEYNRLGNLIRQTEPYFTWEYPENNYYNYNNNGYHFNKLTYESTPWGSISYSHGYNQLTVNKNSKQYKYEYDAIGNTKKSTFPLGSKVEFTYGSHGKPLTINSNDVETVLGYDNKKHQTSLVDVNSGSIAYEYFNDGTIKGQTDARGLTTQITYDNYNRIISKEFPDDNISYEYYTSGDAKDLIKKVESRNSSISYGYDSYQRLIRETHKIDNLDYIFSYEYDQYGNIIKGNYPNGFSLKYIYDANSILTQVNSGDNELIWKAVDYNSFGNPLSTTLRNNMVISYIYNGNYYYLQNAIFKKSNNTVYEMYYQFNHTTWNLINKSETVNRTNQTFTYDDLDRLTGYQFIDYNNNITKSYNIEYDLNGNILKKSDVGIYSYNENGKAHALIGILPVDDNNETITIPWEDQDIDYNSYGKVEKITEGDYELNIFYGPDQERIKSVLSENGNIIYTRYYFGTYEKEIRGNTTREYYYISGPVGIIAVYIKENGVGNLYYTATDYQNTILGLIDMNGNIIEKQNFDPWGRLCNPSDGSYENAQSISTLFRGYTGHEMLPEFGLINMNGRMYDPAVARILSPDNYVQSPFNAQNYNRYSYCLNNPLKYTDPTGDWIWIAVGIGALVGSYIGGSASNGWDMNPVKWDWSSGKTWAGIGLGAVAGGAAGVGFYYAAPALANTGFFSYFGASGTISAYALVGSASLGVAGYVSGFGGGMLYSGGNFKYSHQSGMLGAAIGSAVGGILGAAAGGYKEYLNSYRYKLNRMKKDLKPMAKENVGNDVYGNTRVKLDRKLEYPAQTIPRKLRTNEYYNGYQGRYSKIKIHPDVLDMYFTGDRTRATSAYLHEWFHVGDYYSGYDDYIYSIFGEDRATNYLEMITYMKCFDIFGTGMGSNQMNDYFYYATKFFGSFFPVLNYFIK